jgi:lipoate-protein ligase B
MAINIRNDLRIFDFMIPCGLDGVQMTSVEKETGETFEMQETKRLLRTLLIEFFTRKME